MNSCRMESAFGYSVVPELGAKESEAEQPAATQIGLAMQPCAALSFACQPLTHVLAALLSGRQ